MARIGGVGIVEILSRTGKDHILAKGISSGITIGATITALLSVLPNNKVRVTFGQCGVCLSVIFKGLIL